MIDLVFFDVGGTLIEPHPSVGEVYARAGRAHGLTAPADALETAFRRAWQDHIARAGDGVLTMGRDEASTHLWWRRLVDDVLDAVAFTGDRDAVFAAFFGAFAGRAAWRIHDDVEATLDALDVRNVRMGILSNWDYRLKPLLSALELLPRFDPVVVSSEVGAAKPDVAIFHHAARAASVSPDRILHVGDRVDLDLEPARAVGMSALLIDRPGIHGDRQAIRRLDGVVEFVDRINRRPP
jgi:putative hydrolase of the HAD superfamily